MFDYFEKIWHTGLISALARTVEHVERSIYIKHLNKYLNKLLLPQKREHSYCETSHCLPKLAKVSNRYVLPASVALSTHINGFLYIYILLLFKEIQFVWGLSSLEKILEIFSKHLVQFEFDKQVYKLKSSYFQISVLKAKNLNVNPGYNKMLFSLSFEESPYFTLSNKTSMCAASYNKLTKKYLLIHVDLKTFFIAHKSDMSFDDFCTTINNCFSSNTSLNGCILRTVHVSEITDRQYRRVKEKQKKTNLSSVSSSETSSFASKTANALQSYFQDQFEKSNISKTTTPSPKSKNEPFREEKTASLLDKTKISQPKARDRKRLASSEENFFWHKRSRLMETPEKKKKEYENVSSKMTPEKRENRRQTQHLRRLKRKSLSKTFDTPELKFSTCSNKKDISPSSSNTLHEEKVPEPSHASTQKTQNLKRNKKRKPPLEKQGLGANKENLKQKKLKSGKKKCKKKSKESLKKRTQRKGHERNKRSTPRETKIIKLITKFRSLCARGPTFVCKCCDQLFYRQTVDRLEKFETLGNNAFETCITNIETKSLWVCKTCSNYLKKDQIPPCSTANGNAFKEIPEILADLTPLEWRLVSLRIPFIQISEAPRGKQFKMSKNVVNVPADIVSTVAKLPRTESDMHTIKVKLKKQLRKPYHYMAESVRPNRVIAAVKYLAENTSLYKAESIQLDENWESTFIEELEAQYRPENDGSTTKQKGTEISSEKQNDIGETPEKSLQEEKPTNNGRERCFRSRPKERLFSESVRKNRSRTKIGRVQLIAEMKSSFQKTYTFMKLKYPFVKLHERKNKSVFFKSFRSIKKYKRFYRRLHSFKHSSPPLDGVHFITKITNESKLHDIQKETQKPTNAPAYKVNIPPVFLKDVKKFGTYIGDEVIFHVMNIMKQHKNAENFNLFNIKPAEMQYFLVNKCWTHMENPRETQAGKCSINIHYINEHWLTSMFDPRSKVVHIYDSLSSGITKHDIIQQLQILYDYKTIRHESVTQQQTDPICGVMSLAFAFSLLSNIKPDTITYSLQHMRDHLANIIDTNEITHFPLLRCENKVFADVQNFLVKPKNVFEKDKSMDIIPANLDAQHAFCDICQKFWLVHEISCHKCTISKWIETIEPGIALKVGTYGDFLDDDVINAAMLILAKHDKASSFHICFRKPVEIFNLLADSEKMSNILPSKVPPDKCAINIHYMHAHWVTSMFDPVTKAVHVYDSLPSEQTQKDIMKQLYILHDFQDVFFWPVTRQQSDPICGVLAVAFAYSLLLGISPSDVTYCLEKARGHLKHILSSERVSHFPVVRSEPHCKDKVKNFLVDQPARVNMFDRPTDIHNGKHLHLSDDKKVHHSENKKKTLFFSDNKALALVDIMQKSKLGKNFHISFKTPNEVDYLVKDLAEIVPFLNIKIPEDKCAINLHRLGDVWLTTMYDPHTKTLNIYNPCSEIHQIQQLPAEIKMLHNFSNIQHPNVTQTENISKSGPLAIAFAFSLLSNVDPSEVLYSLDEVFEHLSFVLKKKKVILFPITQRVSTAMDTNAKYVEKAFLHPKNTKTVRKSKKQLVTDDVDNAYESENDDIAGTTQTMLIDKDYLTPNDRHKILNLAPGENQYPVSLLSDPSLEEKCFTEIFVGEPRIDNSQRHRRVQFGELSKSEVRRSDRRVARNIPNLFFKAKKIQLKRLVSSQRVALRKYQTDGKKYDAGFLKTEGSFDKLVRHNEGYKFLKTVRGSPPYFQKAKKDLFAMIRQLGQATFFCSFSSAETMWAHLLRILGKVVDHKNYSDDEIKDMSWETKCRLIQTDPVTCARHFDYQMRMFVSDFLLNKLCPVGDIVDYFFRIEYQSRGSCHAHFLIWVRNAPKYGESDLDSVIKFIDLHISCKKPDIGTELETLVKRQIHRHSRTCKTKNKKCRFSYPQPPMDETCILEPLTCGSTERKIHSTLWKKINKELDTTPMDENMSFVSFLQRFEINKDDYILAVRSSIKSSTIFLERQLSEIRINNYNQHSLLAWQANMDIQFITDVYACAMYIVSYVSKASRGMSEILQRACDEVRNGDFSLRDQFKHISKAFTSSVEICAQEAVYIILGMPMRRASRDFIFLNTNPPEKRTHLLKTLDELKELEDDDEDVLCSNTIRRYMNRPFCMNEISLADWAAWYDKTSYNSFIRKGSHQPCDGEGFLKEIQTDDYTDDMREIPKITKDSNKPLEKRKKARILRSVMFKKDKDPENYYRELLMLYIPWRNENLDLSSDSESYKQRCAIHKAQIDKQLNLYAPSHAELEIAIETMATNTEDHEYYERVAPNIQQQDLEDESRGPTIVQSIHGLEYDMSEDLHLGSQASKSSQVIYREENDTTYRSMVRALNREQREVFDYIVSCVRLREKQHCIFLTGGAGVGKSFLVRTLYQALLKYYSQIPGTDFTERQILLLAPTGKAAYNIKGNTLHSALVIGKNCLLDYKPLTTEALNSFRVKLGDIKYIFIDEISMVGHRMLKVINGRLQELKGSTEPFGGINVLAIGDLFQLKPVFDQWIFKDLKDGYGPLGKNIWIDCFKMFELKTIMRQKDDKSYAELLNRLREGVHTNGDILKLKTRLVSATNPYDISIPHIFFLVKQVKALNHIMLNNLPGEIHNLHAIDKITGECSLGERPGILRDIPKNSRQTMSLEEVIHTKNGQQIDICVNVSVDDGLINGAPGIVKHIQYEDVAHTKPKIVWVLFDDAETGSITRQEKRHLYHYGNIHHTWTPISQITREFKVGEKRIDVQRKQFPFMPSHARTIHKAQGATYKTLVCGFKTSDPTKKSKNFNSPEHLHYVGLSRVCSMENLSILDLNERAIKTDTHVKKEMDRLRQTAKLQIPFDFFYNEKAGTYKMLYINVRSLHKHIADIRNDYNICASDLTILAETRIDNYDDYTFYDIDKFFTFFNNADKKARRRPSHGTAVYTKYPFLQKHPKVENERNIELTIIKLQPLKDISIIAVYRSPNSLLTRFATILEKLLRTFTKNEKIIIIGDFNINWQNIPDNSLIKNLLCAQNGFTQMVEKPTTDYLTTLDHIYVNFNFPNMKCGTFETYYTDHRAIWLTFPLSCL